MAFRQRLKFGGLEPAVEDRLLAFKHYMAEAIIQPYSNGIDTSDATALASHILYPYTAYVKGAKVTGTMVNWGYVSKSLSANESYYLSAGYYSGGVFTGPTASTPTQEAIGVNSSFTSQKYSSAYITVWTPIAGKTVTRVTVISASLTSTTTINFGSGDCTGTDVNLKPNGSNHPYMKISLSGISIAYQETTAVTYTLRISGTVYYS